MRSEFDMINFSSRISKFPHFWQASIAYLVKPTQKDDYSFIFIIKIDKCQYDDMKTAGV